jgi:hypothetical protein
MVLFSFVWMLAACGSAETSSPAPEAGGHAPANVVPGSHEDWCAEHAVPESQCTRCNPSLKIVRPPK